MPERPTIRVLRVRSRNPAAVTASVTGHRKPFVDSIVDEAVQSSPDYSGTVEPGEVADAVEHLDRSGAAMAWAVSVDAATGIGLPAP